MFLFNCDLIVEKEERKSSLLITAGRKVFSISLYFFLIKISELKVHLLAFCLSFVSR